MLTDREKFIVHFLAVAIVGAVDGKNIKSCLGDLFSVNWMQDTDKVGKTGEAAHD